MFRHLPLLLATSALAALCAPATQSQAQDLAQAQAQDDTQRDYLGTQIMILAARAGYGAQDGANAMKTDTPMVDVPQTISVITADQIADQGMTQLGEALRFVPGVSLGTGEGHRDQVLLRGQSTTADFFADGLRDDAQYYRPLYNVERIEVMKGANALIFGRGGGGGAINRVLKTADVMEGFVAGSGTVDSFGGFALAGDVNQPLRQDIALRLNATYEELANHRDFYSGRFVGISPTLSAQLGTDTRMTASYTYDDDARVVDRGIPSRGGRPLAAYDNAFFGDHSHFNHSQTRAHIARARIEHDLSGSFRINGALQFADYDKYYGNLLPGATGTSGSGAATVSFSGYDSANTRRNWIGQANLVGEFATGPITHTLLAGVEAMDQDSTALRNNASFGGAASITLPLAERFAFPAFTLLRNSQSRSALRTVSFYAQDQLDFGPVQLVAGLRHDRFSLSSVNLDNGFAGDRVDAKWSPRLGLIVKPRDTVSLYASYSTSFLPQSGDQFSVLNATSETQVPEKFENHEAGIKWAIAPGLLASAAIFRLDRSNTQASDPANIGNIVLTGSTRVEGFELGLAGEVSDALQLTLGYAMLDGQITTTTIAAPAGRTLQQLPRHQLSGWARYQLGDDWGIGAGAIHQSRQFTTLTNTVVLPAYTRVDAAIYWDAAETLAVQLNLENLFDVAYYPSSHNDNNIQPGAPFNATLGARLRF